MPVGFLTDEQRRRYGHFMGEPTPNQLARYFYLDDADWDAIAIHRGGHNRLGFAVQLCTARFLGIFLEDLSETPPGVVSFLGRQLGIEGPGCFVYYCSSEQRWEHAAEIRRHCGFRQFPDPSAQFRFNRWLYALCWTGTDRPGVLFDRATAWLVAQKVLLPGVTVLERQVARVRSRVQERVWSSLTRGISPETKDKLEALLATPQGGHHSILHRLRKGPFRRSAPELVRALRRIEEIRALSIDVTVSHRVPPGRIQALNRYAVTVRANAIQQLSEERRLATLVAFVLTLEATALDDALDLLDILLTEIFTDATKAGEKARLRTIKDLDAAAVQLGQVCRVLLDPSLPDSEVRTAVFAFMKREDLEAAVRQVNSLIRPPEDVYYEELQQSYRRVRRFLPHLLRTVRFGATPAGKAALEALEYLEKAEREGWAKSGEPPSAIVTRAWRQHVISDDGAIDRKAYVFCCLDRLRSTLRRRDLFVAPSVRYADARLGLLSGAAWEAVRTTICRTLDHSFSAEETMALLSQRLDQTYQAVAANLPTNPSARVEQVDGKHELILTGLDKLDEPPSLVRLRDEVKARLPRVDLPEILLEIAARTAFAHKFTHVTERQSRVSDLAMSICAVLIAEACNTGIEPLVRNDVPALRRSRLSWVKQNFIRDETLAEANACLVAAQNSIPLVHALGRR